MTDLNYLIDPQIAQLRELLSQNKHAEALPILQDVLRRSPCEPMALKMLSIAAIATGQPQVEAELLDELASAAGDDAPFLAYRRKRSETSGDSTKRCRCSNAP